MEKLNKKNVDRVYVSRFSSHDCDCEEKCYYFLIVLNKEGDIVQLKFDFLHEAIIHSFKELGMGPKIIGSEDQKLIEDLDHFLGSPEIELWIPFYKTVKPSLKEKYFCNLTKVKYCLEFEEIKKYVQEWEERRTTGSF